MAEDPKSVQPRLSELKHNQILPDLQPAVQPKPRRWNDVWERLLRLGLGEIALRTGTVLASIALVLLVLWVMGSFYLKGNVVYERDAALAAPLPTETTTIPPPPFDTRTVLIDGGIPRFAQLHTTLPTRARFEITQYEVQKGDTIFGIAEKFGLKPQTLLWGNFDTLADDPHRLQPGQKLNILPVDGVLYEWHAGDGLNGVSKFFGVTPDDIINWPGNQLSPDTVGDFTNPNIEVGTRLFIPGGTRSFISWSAPLISRTDPAKAKIFGPGFCGTWWMGIRVRARLSGPPPKLIYPVMITHRQPTIGASISLARWATPSMRPTAAWSSMPVGMTGATATSSSSTTATAGRRCTRTSASSSSAAGPASRRAQPLRRWAAPAGLPARTCTLS